MPDSSLISYLERCRRAKSCILATNFYNYETLIGVLKAAKDASQPIILQLTESSIKYIGLQMAVTMARTGLNDFDLKGWIHLDHGRDLELVKRCLDAGFDSVMIDASEKPFMENIRITQQVVKMAKPYGAHVEAELGYVRKLGSDYNDTAFTDPQEALQFVESTDTNSLAVAIGSSHGFYKKPPDLDFARLIQISELTKIPLVLHGGSGIGKTALLQAIKNGICKINLATEIKNAFMEALKKDIKDNTDIDLRKVFPPAIEAIRNLVYNKLNVIAESKLYVQGELLSPNR